MGGRRGMSVQTGCVQSHRIKLSSSITKTKKNFNDKTSSSERFAAVSLNTDKDILANSTAPAEEWNHSNSIEVWSHWAIGSRTSGTDAAATGIASSEPCAAPHLNGPVRCYPATPVPKMFQLTFHVTWPDASGWLTCPCSRHLFHWQT